MISAATFRTSAPAISIDPVPMPSPMLSAGQVVKAEVLERMSASKALLSIGGIHLQATTEIAVAPGDVLYFTVRSSEPLMLQLHGMEYRTVNPFSTVESLVRLLNLTSDRSTIGVLSYMLSRGRKISKAEIEENRRMLSLLRSEGMQRETDEEILELIDTLRERKLPVTLSYIMLAKKRALPEDISRLSAELVELLRADEALRLIPESLREPIAAYFKKQRSVSDALRKAVEALGIDYEHSLVAWGVGAADSAKTGSLKAALMALVNFLELAKENDVHAPLHAASVRLLDAIEAQQFDMLGRTETDGEHVSVQIPVELGRALHTLSLTIMEHGTSKMFPESPREYSFHMSVELSELGMVSVAGRLSGRQLAASLTVDDETRARALEEGFGRLADALRADGCQPMSLAARKGLPGLSPREHRTVNASA
ncbi:MAG: hypothetical protein ACM3Q4_08285 [Acidobacteriota bacterium]